MKQHYFKEVDSRTYFPSGFETYFQTLKMLGRHLFPDDWDGEEEFRVRNHRPESASVTDGNLAVARAAIKETESQHMYHLLDDDEALLDILARQNSESVAEPIAAYYRFEDMAAKLRGWLIEKKLVAVGLSDDGSYSDIPDHFWRGHLATEVLYDGSCWIDSDGFTKDWKSKDSSKRYIIFESKTVCDFIWELGNGVRATKLAQQKQAYSWLSEIVSSSPNKKLMTKEDAQKTYNNQHYARVSDHAWRDIWSRVLKEQNASDAWSARGAIPQE